MDFKSKFQSFIHSLPGLGLCTKEATIDDIKYQRMKSQESKKIEYHPRVVTIDDILDEIGLGFFHVKLFLLLGSLFFLVSLEISVLSFISPLLKLEWNLSVWHEALLPLVTTCGMTVGASFWGWVSDRYGRKPALVGSTSFILCFGFASSFALNYYWISVFLFFTGIGLALETQVITMIEEFFPKENRTKFSLAACVFWTLGFLISALVRTQESFVGFRGLLFLVCIPAAMFLTGTTLVPESPRFCLASGDGEKALQILQRTAPANKSAMFRKWQLYQNVHDTNSTRGNVVELFRHGYAMITSLLWLIWFFSFLSYYFTVFSVTEIAMTNNVLKFEHAHANHVDHDIDNSHYSTLAWMTIPEIFLILSTTLASHYIEDKTLILLYTLVAVILQSVVLIVGFKYETTVLVLIILTRGILLCQGTLIFIYTTEVYPTTTRGIGMGTAYSMSRIGMIAGPFVAQTLSHFHGIILNVVSLVLALLTAVALPRHKLDQMLE